MIPLLALTLGCGTGPGPTDEVAPADLGLEECAVCGMVVREQPAPRAQVLHRDGTRAMLCSIGDLRAHLASPSPHGKAQGAWVEALPPGTAPDALGTAPRPWLATEAASYVVGVPRPAVMGEPVLSYATPAQAAEAAAALGGWTTTWAALQATPFHELPARPVD